MEILSRVSSSGRLTGWKDKFLIVGEFGKRRHPWGEGITKNLSQHPFLREKCMCWISAPPTNLQPYQAGLWGTENAQPYARNLNLCKFSPTNPNPNHNCPSSIPIRTNLVLHQFPQSRVLSTRRQEIPVINSTQLIFSWEPSTYEGN